MATQADAAGVEVLIGSAMAGYDGHRGSVYYLAIAPGHQRAALGRRLMQEVERRLLALGCPKVNVLVRTSNVQVLCRGQVFSDIPIGEVRSS